MAYGLTYTRSQINQLQLLAQGENVLVGDDLEKYVFNTAELVWRSHLCNPEWLNLHLVTNEKLIVLAREEKLRQKKIKFDPSVVYASILKSQRPHIQRLFSSLGSDVGCYGLHAVFKLVLHY